MTWHRTENEWTHPDLGSIRYSPDAGWYLESVPGEQTGPFPDPEEASRWLEWFLSGWVRLPGQSFRHEALGEIERNTEGLWVARIPTGKEIGPFSTAFGAMELLHRRDKVVNWMAQFGGLLVLGGLLAIAVAPSIGGLPLAPTILAVTASSLIVWLTRHRRFPADEAAIVAAGIGSLMTVIGAAARVAVFAATALVHWTPLPHVGQIALAGGCVSLLVGRWLERIVHD